MNTFKRKDVEKLRSEINSLLNEVLGEKYGISLGIKNIRYTDSSFTTTLECYIGIGNMTNLRLKEEVKKKGYWYGLKYKHVGTKFTILGTLYEFIGIQSRAKKFPIIAKAKDGKLYKLARNVSDDIVDAYNREKGKKNGN